MKCFFPNCKLSPILVCECKPKQTLMCQFHRSNHFEAMPNSKHKISHLSETEEFSGSIIKTRQSKGFESSNSKSEKNVDYHILKKKLKEVKSIIKATKMNIVDQAEKAKLEISSYSNYLISQLKGLEMKYQKLSISLKESYVRKFSDLWNQEQFKISKLKFKIDKLNTKNALNTILAELENNKTIDLSIPKKECNLYIIKPETKTILCLNPNKHLVASLELNLPNNLFGSSLCYAEGNLFCYGNSVNKSYEGTAFFINKEGKIKFLKDGLPCIYSGCIYSKGFIYVFGGWSGGSMITNARRFNIKKNQWQELADLPSAGSLYCCEIVKNKILISGSSHSRLYIYDAFCNSYCRSTLKLCQGRKKIICKYKKIVYIIEAEGNIYESSSGNIFEWKILCASNIQNRGMLIYKSYSINSTYFSIDNKIFRFDLNTKALGQEYELENI